MAQCALVSVCSQEGADSNTLNPSYVPSILYRINPETGAATKIVNLVGSSTVMGLAFARDGKLYATDFAGSSGLYPDRPQTGFESAVAAMPFGLSTGLELADPLPVAGNHLTAASALFLFL